MLRRILIILLTFFISSCQTIKLQEQATVTKKDSKTVVTPIIKNNIPVKDIGAIIADVEKDFSNTIIETKRYGSSVRFYLPHHASFATASSQVTEPLKKELQFVFEKLESYNYSQIKVYGFADNRGDSNYNQELSFKRALSVSREIKNVTKVKKMSYEGFGETLPLAENDSRYWRLLNRRTEIVVYFN